MKTFLKNIIIIVCKPFNYLNTIIPKKNNRIVIFSDLGFRDNVKALYQFLVDNNYNDNYYIICSLNDYKKYSHIHIKNVKFVNNYIGLFYFLRSRFFFYSFGRYPIKPSKNQMVINLWHGMPLKRIGNLEYGKEDNDYNFFTYILSTSPFFTPILCQAFSCQENQILVSGLPRNDYLFIEKVPVKEKLHLPENKKLVFWMPTFRNSDKLNEINSLSEKNYMGFPLIESIQDFDILDEVLSQSNIILLIKPHPMQSVSDIHTKATSIKFITDNDMYENDVELYSLLQSCDALITDYSSVYIDYLLLNRPIGFIVEDIEDYLNQRGFVVDNPLSYMPGEKIKDIEMLKRFLSNVGTNKDDFYSERKQLKELFHTYPDYGSCLHILNFCGIKNKEGNLPSSTEGKR